MRRTIAIAIALTLASVVPTLAALTPLQTAGYQTTHISGRLPIAVVMNDDMWYSTDRNDYYAAENQNVGRLWKLLQEQGQEVHFYNSSHFRPISGASKADSQYVYGLWRNMGTRYAVCYVLGMRGVYSPDPAHTRRFICPDSTNVQLIVCGTPNMLYDYPAGSPTARIGTAIKAIGNITANAASGSGDGTHLAFTTASGDSFFAQQAMVGSVAYAYPLSPYGSITVSGTISFSYFFTADPGTHPFASIGPWGRVTLETAGTGSIEGEVWQIPGSDSTRQFYGITGAALNAVQIHNGTCTLRFWPSDSTAPHISKIVQLFKPPSTGTFAHSTAATFRTDSLVVYSDSVATTANEALPIAYRVYWDPPATNGFSPSWLSNPTESRHTDFVLFAGTLAPLTPYYAGEIMYTLGSRYARLDPIKLAYEWDDHGTFGADKPDSLGAQYLNQWPYADSLASFRNYLISKGVPRTFNTTGPADSLYAMATTYQTGWGGRQTRYPNLASEPWTFVPHIHDTTSSHPFSVVLGTGSHQTYGGGAISFDHRVAFGLNPAGMVKYGAADFPTWGIYQRLKMNDSLYTAKFGPGRTVPYLSFPNNFAAPIDMRANQHWIGRAPGVLGTGDVPPDSLFAAFVCAGKRFVRGTVYGQTPFRVPAGTTPLAPTYAYLGTTDTSMYVQTWFSNADQMYYGKIPDGFSSAIASQPGTRTYQIRNIGAVPLTQNPTARVTAPKTATYARAGVDQFLPNALGAANHMEGSYNPQDMFGQAAVGTTAMSLIGRSTDIGRFRMVYQHPIEIQWALNGLWGDQPTEKILARVRLFDPLSALCNLAGHDLVRWVNPWDLYR